MTSILRPSALAAALGLALGTAAYAQSDTGTTPMHDNSAATAPATGGSAGSSMSSDTIRQVQQQLSDKGLYTAQVDGVMGPKTHAALKEFQQKQGMQASGKLDSSTLAALGVSSGGVNGGSSSAGSTDQGTSGSSTSAPSSTGSNDSGATPPSTGSTTMPSDTGSHSTPPAKQ